MDLGRTEQLTQKTKTVLIQGPTLGPFFRPGAILATANFQRAAHKTSLIAADEVFRPVSFRPVACS